MPIRCGVDVAEISRVKDIIDRYGDHFKQRFFSQYEQQYGDSKWNSPQTYAGMWAAKEAVFKVLGKGKRWNDIFIDHEPHGRPLIDVDASLLELPHIPIPKDAQWDCSITHDANTAIAFAVCQWPNKSSL